MTPANPYALPMTEALLRFGDVPASFVEAERAFERKLEDLKRWLETTRTQTLPSKDIIK